MASTSNFLLVVALLHNMVAEVSAARLGRFRVRTGSVSKSSADLALQGLCNRDRPKNFKCFTLSHRSSIFCGMARPIYYNQKPCNLQETLELIPPLITEYETQRISSSFHSPNALISLDHDEVIDIQTEAGKQGFPAFRHGCVQTPGGLQCNRDNEVCSGCVPAYDEHGDTGGTLIVEDFESPKANQLKDYVMLVAQLADGGSAVGGASHNVVTHCAGGMGRTGIHLMAFVAFHYLTYECDRFDTWEQAVIEAMYFVQKNYHHSAGEFTDVPENYARLVNFLWSTLRGNAKGIAESFGEKWSVSMCSMKDESQLRVSRDQFKAEFGAKWKAAERFLRRWERHGSNPEVLEKWEIGTFGKKMA